MANHLRTTLLASAFALAGIPLAYAKTITVASGTTNTQSQSVSGTDHLTVDSDGQLSVDDTAIKWKDASTDLIIDNYGVIESTEDEGRAINASGDATAPRTITLNNYAGAVIQSQDDAFRINIDITGGTVTVNNAGTILSSVDGQALDFDAVDSTGTDTAKIIINNLATGVIQANGADAIRPGQGAVVTNAGLIYSDGVIGDKNDGIDWQSHSGTVINLSSGTISGQRHGITTDTDVTVYNYGTITGRNGSGVGSDGNGTVINYGTITGAYVGTGDGDGDGVDIDYVGVVDNYGTIQATGAGGTHDGTANVSEGITIGGSPQSDGTITNHAGATITGVGTGISAFGHSYTIVNDGTIVGGYAAIVGEGLSTTDSTGATLPGTYSITNTGTIESTSSYGIDISEGNVTLTNSGTISGGSYAIALGTGNDTLIIQKGSSISGLVDAGGGDNTLELDDGATFDTGTNFQSLKVNGSATLTGDNDIATTTIASGARLQLGNAGTTGFVNGAIEDDGTLAIDRSDTVTLSNPITGSGGFEQSGSGVTVLNAANTFTGDTTVKAGTLVVGDDSHADAALPGTVTVNSGATLSGIGSIGGLVLAGVVAPGNNSTGTLTMNGDSVFQKGSSYQIDVAPDGTSDHIVINGSATILGGSALALAPNGNWQLRTNYTILSASGGVDGTFDSVSSSLAFLTPSLSYTADTVGLTLERNGTYFSEIAQTANQRDTANAVNAGGFGNPVFDAVVLLDAPTALSAFDQLSGEVHASTRSALFDDSHYVRDAIDAHLQGLDKDHSATDSHQITAWSSVWGHWGDHEGDGNAAPLQADGSGLLVGADLPVGDAARLGAIVGSGQSSVQVDTRNSTAHALATHLGAYGSMQSGQFRLQAGMAYSWQNVDSYRQLAFGDFAAAASAHYHAETAQVYADGSYVFNFSRSTLAPFLNVARVQLHTDAFTESGSSGLAVSAQTSSVNYAILGLRNSLALDRAASINAHLQLGWQHAWGDTASESTMRFAGGGDEFAISGVPVAPNAAVLNAGVSWMIAPNVLMDASYSGQFASNAKDQSARMSLSWAF